jgi:hypothetical protein
MASTALVSVVAIHWVYTGTRENYLQVGHDNGSIDARMQTAETIRRSVPLTKCQELRDQKLIRLISVKTVDVAAVVNADGSVRLCEY